VPTDLVSTPPAPTSPAGSKVTPPEFWPEIDVNRVRAQVNLGGEIPHERLVEAIASSVVLVTDELADWQAAQEEAGFEALDEVDPGNTITTGTGEAAVEITRLEHLFFSAVAAHTAARLADRNPDLTATREGSDRGDQRRDMAGELRRDATHAIRQIQGKPRTNAELI